MEYGLYMIADHRRYSPTPPDRKQIYLATFNIIYKDIYGITDD